MWSEKEVKYKTGQPKRRAVQINRSCRNIWPKISFRIVCLSRFWTKFPTTLILYCSYVHNFKKVDPYYQWASSFKRKYNHNMIVDHSSCNDHSKEEKKSFRSICTTIFDYIYEFPAHFDCPPFRFPSLNPLLPRGLFGAYFCLCMHNCAPRWPICTIPSMLPSLVALWLRLHQLSWLNLQWWRRYITCSKPSRVK